MSRSAVSQHNHSRQTKAQLIEELEKLRCRIRDLERREGRQGAVESGTEDRGIGARQPAEEALREAPDTLEMRVAARTAELQRANEALMAQIAESASRERALRASEAQLEEALDAMSEGFVYFDAEDRFIRANSKHRELFPSHAAYMVPGARFEDLLKKQIQNIRLPWAVGREDEWMAERLAQHRNPGPPVEQVFADGRIIRHSEYRTRSGGTVSIRADITELKRIERALRESEQRASAAEQQLLDAIESISEGFVLFDAGGRLVLCNSKYKKFYRYSDSDAAPGVHTRDLGALDLERGTVDLGTDDPEAYLGRRDRQMDAPLPSYTIQLTGNRHLQTRDHRTASGGIVSIQTDITDLKEAEENLRRSEEQYRDLVEGSMQGVALHSDFKPHFVNQAWADIFGYDSPDEVIALGSIVSLLAPHERERMAAIRDARLRGDSAPEPYEFQGLRKDGTLIWLQNTGRAVAWNGEPAILSVVLDITERKRAEQALRDSEERFRAITEASPVPLVITRRSDGIILYANPKVGPAFGLPADQVVGRSVTEFYGDPSVRHGRLAALGADGYVRDDEIEMRKADGSPISTVHSLQAIEYRGEAAVLGGFYDITERKRAEGELRQSEERFRDITANVPGIVYQFRIDAAGEPSFPYVSPAIKDILGVEAADAVADPNTWFDTVHPDDRPGLDASIEETHRTLDPWLWEGRSIRTTGEVGWFRGSSTPRKQDDGSVLWTGLVLDITEHKQAEESSARFGRIIERSVNEVYVFDAGTLRFIQVNQGARKNLGYTMEELAALTPIDLKPEFTPEAFAEVLGPLRQGDKEQVVFETVHERKDSSTYEVEVRLQLMAEETPPVFVAIVQDITERKQLEEQLRQAQKMEAVGQLTGGVAHDFNNLLAVIMGNVELLEDRLGSEDKTLRAIFRAAGRGSELTQRLLAYSRRQPLRPQAVDLGALVSGMSELLTRTLGETTDIETSAVPGLWDVWADPGQVENAVLNLALNARDAMAAGGKLTIECDNVCLGAPDGTRNPEAVAGDYVVLAVSDTGSGMSAEVHAQAFEPFYTTKDVGQGSGLGLSMVYGFAKQSDGQVSIYSEPGRGTTVRLYLPRAGEAPIGDIAFPDAELLRGRDEVVLVIEDDPDVRDLAVRMLKDLGYRVIQVPDAAGAREVLAAGRRVDLVISDVVLPGGTSGPEFAAEARARDPGLKVIFMSGYPARAAMRGGFLAADNVLLTKPFRRHQLAKVLREALD